MSLFATPRSETLTGLLESYDELRQWQERLTALRHQAEQVRGYLAMPGSNRALGQARLDRLREQYSAALAGLRFTRREAHRRLGLTASTARRVV